MAVKSFWYYEKIKIKSKCRLLRGLPGMLCVKMDDVRFVSANVKDNKLACSQMTYLDSVFAAVLF